MERALYQISIIIINYHYYIPFILQAGLNAIFDSASSYGHVKRVRMSKIVYILYKFSY